MKKLLISLAMLFLISFYAISQAPDPSQWYKADRPKINWPKIDLAKIDSGSLLIIILLIIIAIILIIFCVIYIIKTKNKKK